MKVLMISKDRKVFEKGSAVRTRMMEYADLFEELHIVVLAKTGDDPLQEKVSEKLFLYSPHSENSFFIFLKALGAAFKVGGRLRGKKDAFVSSQDPFETGLIAFMVSKMFGLRLQLQIHTDFLSPFFKKESWVNRVRVFIANTLLGSADSIRVVSERIKDSLLKKKIPSEKIHVLPVFVDVSKIKNQKITVDLKKKYKEFGKIVLAASRFEREKNIFLGLDAFKKIHDADKNIGLVLAGEGSLRQNLEEYAKKIGIDTHTRILPWQNDIISLYKTADLLLVTSLHEGYGMFIVEALASGCPVVSTDVGVARSMGAEIISYNADEIATKSLKLLSEGRKEFQVVSLSKQEYLQKFKETFV